MAVLPVLHYGDPVLRRKAKPVERVDKDVRRLLEDMLETMLDAPGIGLAANQVGRLVRCVVVAVEDIQLMIANPRIAEKHGETEGTEACLSLPELQATVPRAERIVVSGLNRNNRPAKVEVGGLLSRCLQHEIDHLDGCVFVDRAREDTVHWVVKEGEDEEGEPIFRHEPTTPEAALETLTERWLAMNAQAGK